LLLDVYFELFDNEQEDLASIISDEINSRRGSLLNQLTMLLEPKKNAPVLIHADYFESIQQKVAELGVPE